MPGEYTLHNREGIRCDLQGELQDMDLFEGMVRNANGGKGRALNVE